MTSSSLVISSCFQLLTALNNPPCQDRLPLNALLAILQERDTPFYTFMTAECAVSLIKLCSQFVPQKSTNAADSSNNSEIGLDEFTVIVKILCSAAGGIGEKENSRSRKVLALLHVTISHSVAAAALELASDVKKSVYSCAGNFSSDSHTSIVAGNLMNSSMIMNDTTDHQHLRQQHQQHSSFLTSVGGGNSQENTSTTFDVDLDFVRNVSNFIDHHGTKTTVEKVIQRLEKVKKENNNKILVLGKEAVNLWKYAFDTRSSVGGMTEETRQDLIGAALEVSGREMFPSVSSTHVAAELTFQKILDLFL